MTIFSKKTSVLHFSLKLLNCLPLQSVLYEKNNVAFITCVMIQKFQNLGVGLCFLSTIATFLMSEMCLNLIFCGFLGSILIAKPRETKRVKETFVNFSAETSKFVGWLIWI